MNKIIRNHLLRVTLTRHENSQAIVLNKNIIIMKTTLLTLILTIIVLNLSARSFPKDTLRGKNASYHREFILSAVSYTHLQTIKYSPIDLVFP